MEMVFENFKEFNEALTQLEDYLLNSFKVEDKQTLNKVLKYMQDNDVDYTYDKESATIEITDVGNLTTPGMRTLKQMLADCKRN